MPGGRTWEGKEAQARQEWPSSSPDGSFSGPLLCIIGMWTALTWSFPARDLELFCKVLLV